MNKLLLPPKEIAETQLQWRMYMAASPVMSLLSACILVPGYAQMCTLMMALTSPTFARFQD